MNFKLLLITLTGLLLAGCSPDTAKDKPGKERKPPVNKVILSKVRAQPVSVQFQRPGFVEFRRLARIYNREEGRIIQVGGYEGDTVEKGQTLIALDTELLEAEINKAEANRSRAQQKLRRIKRLIRSKSASEEELLEAQTELKLADAELDILKIRRSYARIQAPFSGQITARLVEPGDIKPRSSHLLTLIDPDSAVIKVALGEKKLLQVKRSHAVKVLFLLPQPKEFAGRISRLHPRLNPETHQGTVEISLDTTPPEVFEAQRVKVFFSTPLQKATLIPFSALRQDRQGEFVFRFEQDKVLRTPVRSGTTIGQDITIIEGLEVGQFIVTRGFMGLTNGAAAKPISEKTNDSLPENRP